MITFRHLLASTLVLLVGSAMFNLFAGQGGGGVRTEASATLKPVTSVETTPDDLGFIRRWVILEPISIGSQQSESASKAAVKTEYFPGQLTVLPKDGDKVAVRGNELTWHAVDSIHYNVNLYHFAFTRDKSSSGALFWAVTVVNCPQDMPDVRLAIGSNASSIWWVNGQEVIGIYGDIQTVVDDGVSRRLSLKKGTNVIRCAVVNGSGAADFCARLLDNEGKPLKGFTLTAGNQ
jgi:hypothetical protein